MLRRVSAVAVAVAIGIGTGWRPLTRRAAAAPPRPVAQAAPQRVPPLDATATPLTDQNLVGHKLWLLVFDKTGMQLGDVQRVLENATAWLGDRTSNVDVVAVAEIGANGLQLLQDFTSDSNKLRRAVAAF